MHTHHIDTIKISITHDQRRIIDFKTKPKLSENLRKELELIMGSIDILNFKSENIIEIIAQVITCL